MKTNYKLMIENRVNTINWLLGTDYQTNFAAQYGGWKLYRVNKQTGGTYCDKLGFDLRKSSKEMTSYLDGIVRTLSLYLPF